MRRHALALFVSTALVGCVSVDPPPHDPGGCAGGGCAGGACAGGACAGSYGRGMGPPSVPGLQDGYGNKVPMAAPYSSSPPPTAWHAAHMMQNSMPMSMVQMNNPGGSMPQGGPSAGLLPQTMMPRTGLLSPPGVPFAPGMPSGSGVMPASFNPGMMPGDMRGGLPSSPMVGFGSGMPGPGGVVQANVPPGGNPMEHIQLAQFTQPGAGGNPWGQRYASQRTQVKFNRPAGMKVFWFANGPDGKPMYSTTPIETPGRWNFAQAAIYRLKLTNIEGRPELEVYPTMEVVQSSPRTEAFLSHSAVPVEFTAEDFKQIVDGNYVVKVIYLPDPQFQDVAGTGTDEILSTRLDPGADPIQEARRRGSVLLVIRMGNVHQELEHSPPLNAPASGQSHQKNRSASPTPPMMPPDLSVGPGFGPDYPNRPLMQVPYYGTPGCPPGTGNPPGMQLPNTPPAGTNTPMETPPRMPPAQGYYPQPNPGATTGNQPNYYLPPAGTPSGSPRGSEGTLPSPTGIDGSLPPTNLAPSIPSAAPPSKLSPQVSGPPSTSSPPTGFSAPPPGALGTSGSSSTPSSVQNSNPGAPGRQVIRRPSIFADPTPPSSSSSEAPKTAAPSAAPPASSGILEPPPMPPAPVSTDGSVKNAPANQLPGGLPVSGGPPQTSATSSPAGDIPLPPLPKTSALKTSALKRSDLPTPPSTSPAQSVPVQATKAAEKAISDLKGLPPSLPDPKLPVTSSTSPAPASSTNVDALPKLPQANLPTVPESFDTKPAASSSNGVLPIIPDGKLPTVDLNAIPALPSAPSDIRPATPNPASQTSQLTAPSNVQPAAASERRVPTTAELAGQTGVKR